MTRTTSPRRRRTGIRRGTTSPRARCPLPGDAEGLPHTLREYLDEFVDDEPLVVLRAAEQMEAIVADYGPIGARYITGDAVPLPRPAKAIAATEKAAGSRLAHYTYLSGSTCRTLPRM
ncbi:hypothetical protein ACFU8I_08715 [Streptomyces sp. NPDC057540]|uniref:hypothetical protein n=1 Tax=Streptomyces sp. NPDC057540 TaxID=3346160 RepID=UPI0036D0EBF9